MLARAQGKLVFQYPNQTLSSRLQAHRQINKATKPCEALTHFS